MLRLLFVFMASLAWLALSGCSASDPPPAAAAEAAQPGPGEQPPGTPTQPVSGTVPPALGPVGPIPGPELPGENPTVTIQNPYASDPSALEQGRQLFVQMNCSGCHGGHAGGGMGPSLRDNSWIYGETPAAIYDSISMGRAHGMPAWGTKLPADVIWKLVAYIQSIGTPDEPDKVTPAPAKAPDSAAAQIK